MFKSPLIRNVLLCTSLLFFAPPAAQAQTTTNVAAQKTTVLAAEGRVEAMRLGSENWLPAQTNQTLNFKDRFRTGMKSRATLRLSDQSVFRVNQLTVLEIQPPAAEGKTAVLDLKTGAAYFYNRQD